MRAFALIPFASNVAPAAQIIADPSKHGCPGNYPFNKDNPKLIISEGKLVLTEKPFCSSYAKASASVEQHDLGTSTESQIHRQEDYSLTLLSLKRVQRQCGIRQRSCAALRYGNNITWAMHTETQPGVAHWPIFSKSLLAA
jgi:hypothetical protein